MNALTVGAFGASCEITSNANAPSAVESKINERRCEALKGRARFTMKRLLCIVGGMNAGGAETQLMKIYRALDRTKYQMDFAVTLDAPGFYDEEIRAMGGRIFHIAPKSKKPWKNFNDVRKLVKRERYYYVLRTSEHALSALELFAARLGGAKKRVYRSSNSRVGSARSASAYLHRLCRFMPKRFANARIAPSTEAAEFMFGKGCVDKGKATLLHNAIDLSVFTYDETARQKIRNELGISEEKLILGHVGRFSEQKNHLFLIEVFKKICEQTPNAILLLVGAGSLKERVERRAEELGVRNSVIFTGVRSDVPALLAAMDVFVFPSFYEGMPNTVIEAQATGLPCVVSDTITREANVADLVKFLPLSSADKWAEEILQCVRAPRGEMKDVFIDKRYGIQGVADEFVKLVFEN